MVRGDLSDAVSLALTVMPAKAGIQHDFRG